MTKRFIRWTDEPTVSAEELGGKVNSLAEMVSAGFEVPPAFGVTTHAFSAFATQSGLHERIAEIRSRLDLDDLSAVHQASGEIRALIEDTSLPQDLESEVREAYAELERRADQPSVPVAVRSSGVNEDLDGASFAGQYDTYLWVCGADDVLNHVKRCWTGLFGPAVLTYRPSGAVAAAQDDALASMCVGVQQMVRARAAGVMFTLDPVSGDRSKVVLESCWGLGEGVVKGDVTPDRHRVDKVTMEILDREIGDQETEYRFVPERGAVDLVPIEDGHGAEPSLTPEDVLRVAELGLRVERHRGACQDLEWAISEDGELALLQARPETVWSARRAAERAAQTPAAGATDRVMSTFLRFGAASKT